MALDASREDRLRALADARRRELYEYVLRRGERGVGRDEAASATGLTRGRAAFHLDQLVEAGLLATEFRRLSERSGPGAGRPAKLYRAAAGDISLTVPERRYLLGAQILLDALSGQAGGLRRATAAARRRGMAAGRSVAEDEPATADAQATADEPLERQLEALGYAPRRAADGSIRLANCPFHELVSQDRPFTCRTNLAFLRGLLAGLGRTAVAARLAPEPGWCCVRFDPVSTVTD